MQRIKIKTDAKLYILEIILLFGICLFTMLQYSNIVSLLFHLTFFVLVFGLVIQLYNKPWLNSLHVLAAIIIIIAFLHVAIQAGTWSFSYYKKLIIFSCSVLMMPFLECIEVNKKLVNWILNVNIILSIAYIIHYFFGSNIGYIGRYLTFHYTNPNLTAMFLFHSFLYCAIALYYRKKIYLRILLLIVASMMLYFILKTTARSCFVAIAFFMIFVFLNIVLKKDIRFSKSISLLIILLPLLIAVVYMIVVDSGILESVLSFLDLGEGKTLNSRVSEWTIGFNAFFNHPILGDYYGISNGLGMSQKHNTHVDILASYGLVPFVLFIALLYKTVKKVLPTATTNFSRMSLYAFFAVLIQGSFEAALVSGGVGLYIMSFGFLILAKYNENIGLEKK